MWSLEEFLLIIRYYANRKKLPFFWGNSKWYTFNNLVFPASELSPKSKHWKDHSLISTGSTCEMLKPPYEFHEYRKKLNNQILDMYLTEHGCERQSDPIVILTSGGTASGKTSSVDMLVDSIFQAERDQFLRIDYDGIKKNIPEYPEMLLKTRYAARYVQSESAKIGGRLFKKAYAKGVNIIYEKTLDDEERTLEDIKNLKKKGYKIYVVATHLPVAEGLRRAEIRYQKMGRHVPEEVIKGIYSNVPKTLFAIRRKVDGILLFDNSGSSLKLIFQKSRNKTQINRLPYNQYLIDVGSQYDLSL